MYFRTFLMYKIFLLRRGGGGWGGGGWRAVIIIFKTELENIGFRGS